VHLNLDKVRTDDRGIVAVATFFCSAPAGSPDIVMYAAIPGKMTIGEHSLTGVVIETIVYRCTCCFRQYDPCVQPEYTFKGVVSGKARKSIPILYGRSVPHKIMTPIRSSYH